MDELKRKEIKEIEENHHSITGHHINLLAFAKSKHTNEGIKIPTWLLKKSIQSAAEAAIKLGITFPEFKIKNQMKANSDLTPWKRFIYIFCPGLKRRARVQALLDLQRKEENLINKEDKLESIWVDCYGNAFAPKKNMRKNENSN